MKAFYEQDANLDFLKNKTIAVIGYGSQGHAHAQNLRDSGLNVIVGQRSGGANYALAKEHGFAPMSAAEAAAAADVIMILLPDQHQARVYREDIAPNLKPGKSLVFAHGFNIHFCQIEPPKDVDVFMVAPKGPGHLVRRTFTEGGGVPCVFAVHQDATGEAIYEGGFGKMRHSISDTAEFGDYRTGRRIITDETRKAMKQVLSEIQDGTFARDFILECGCGYPSFKAKRRIENDHQIEQVGGKLRALMPWLKK